MFLISFRILYHSNNTILEKWQKGKNTKCNEFNNNVIKVPCQEIDHQTKTVEKQVCYSTLNNSVSSIYCFKFFIYIYEEKIVFQLIN